MLAQAPAGTWSAHSDSRRGLALLAAALLLLPACGGGDQPPGLSTPGTVPPAPVTEATGGPAATPAPPAIVPSRSPPPTRGPTATDPATEATRGAEAPVPGTFTPTPRPLDQLVERSLAALSPEAAAYLATRPEVVGVAVIVPGRGMLYAAHADEPFPMASVAKVAILAAVLDWSQREDREPTERERALLTPMITVSDNDAATELWAEVGGAEGMDRYLQAIGLPGIRSNPREYWGASHASARAVALLFAKLAWGDILDAPRRALALDLLSAVVPAQRWGASAGVPESVPEGTVIALKDGWYPGELGWWVNSAGLILPGTGQPAYAIAVLTRQQPSFEVGVETIEGIAERVHAALHPSRP